MNVCALFSDGQNLTVVATEGGQLNLKNSFPNSAEAEIICFELPSQQAIYYLGHGKHASVFFSAIRLHLHENMAYQS